MSIEVLLKEFQDVAYSPNKQLANFKAQGKKVIGCYISEMRIHITNKVFYRSFGWKLREIFN